LGGGVFGREGDPGWVFLGRGPKINSVTPHKKHPTEIGGVFAWPLHLLRCCGTLFVNNETVRFAQ
jgi:hypothetical protein